MKIVHCRKCDYTQYIGRPKAGLPWNFGNPFVIGVDGNREEVIWKFDNWLDLGNNFSNKDATEERRQWILDNIYTLKDKTLGCFCDFPHEDCHGRILMKNYYRLSKTHIRNWFSNMLPLDVPYSYQNISYPTSENFYQAMKLNKDDIDNRKFIASLPPHKAKTELRKKKYQIRENWEKCRIPVMRYILEYKFSPGTSWHGKLVSTDDYIVEWTTWGDIFWGKDIDTGLGENNLGKLLMEIRDKHPRK